MIHIVRMKMDKLEVDSLRSFREEKNATEYLREELLRQYGFFDQQPSTQSGKPYLTTSIRNIRKTKKLEQLLKYICSGDQKQPEFHVVWN